ncbi:MAG: ABC transporter ATP-binding protein [Lachnospiraceae bacterium]|nr:ABC transporter ATP-binding protein [Lachnospiraceae bacterium]MBQ6544893.1 ABC transporter ATP-binding protein [Lachnospiraceae bacterium]
MEYHLRLAGLHKRFGNTEVLRGVSLQVAKGEFITLLGASGCGKTTTIRLIAGLDLPDNGSIFLNGEDITDLPPEKRNVNTVFQNYALFPHMNVADNISYGLRIRKVPKAQRDARVEELLSLVQLEGSGHKKVSALSGGQKQRVAIARAVAASPEVLLLDEPLGALDLKLRREMQLELKRLQKTLGITFIYITHDQEEAINMSDRIAVMHDGLFEQIGTPDEIYYKPRTSYVANFVGSANVIRRNGKTYAVRAENVIFGDLCPGERAQVIEKSFAGGQLRILFKLPDGQMVTASRFGLNSAAEPGDEMQVGWKAEDAVEVLDNGV